MAAGDNRVRRFRADIALLFLAILALLVGGGALYYNDALTRRNAAQMETARQVKADALVVSRLGDVVARGLLPNFADVSAQMENFEYLVGVLRAGDAEVGTPAMPSAASPQVEAVEKAWAASKALMERMLQSEINVGRATAALRSVNDSSARLAVVYREVLARLIAGDAGAAAAGLAGEQLARTEQMRVLTARVLGEGRDASKIVAELAEVITAFAAGHRALIGADGAVGEVLRRESESVQQLGATATQLGESAAALDELQSAAGVLPREGSNLYSTAIALEARLVELPSAGEWLRRIAFPALGIAALALLAYAIINIVTVRRRIRRAEERDAKQQAAILSLLDEITNLADGDLTVNVTVTEDFTGAIGDSINYTVDTLRGLVGTINETSVEIAAAAGSTQATAESMNQASENQAAEIVEIAHRITRSSESLNTVASRAEQLARQANESVTVAHNGATVVNRTVQGMTALRDQIQDTAKRIKRLGESSQEIGNIIEFINDIAEQTNTLALNASIQAAMAGESGRGFAVVADEVQRLAERAANATRQIETLVKTIQADTNEAMVSMERSTSNVVAGARSAEEAGQSLVRIESSSTDLSRLIQDISTETRAEAAQATRIAGQMQSVREIGLQTAQSAEATAAAVGELNALSEKLRESVAGFKLPVDMDMGMGMQEPATV